MKKSDLTGNERDTRLAIWYDNSGIKHTVNIQQYKKWEKEQNKEKIAEFIYQRLYSRYLKPFQFDCCEYKEQYKNGFGIMANCCLLIETLQSFKEGTEDSDRNSRKAFDDFFRDNYSDFNDFIYTDFYKNVRCGILHQGETTGGWIIRRDGKLFEKTTLTINARKFADKLKDTLRTYTNQLKNDPWDSVGWNSCREKMGYIIDNCKRKNSIDNKAIQEIKNAIMGGQCQFSSSIKVEDIKHIKIHKLTQDSSPNLNNYNFKGMVLIKVKDELKEKQIEGEAIIQNVVTVTVINQI
jgi:hypothetical protein